MILKRSANAYQLFNPTSQQQFVIRPDSSDVLVYIEIFFHKEYQLIDQLNIKTSPTILDLGANVGFFAMYSKSRWPNARIVCVEPDTNNLNQLKRQVEINKFNDIHIISAGIWTSNSNLTIAKKEDQMEWALQVKSDVQGTIQGLTLQQVIQDSKISKVDLLKIDIEGTEEALFRNEAFLFTLGHHVENIIMETHNPGEQTYIMNQLVAIGFEVTRHSELLLARKV